MKIILASQSPRRHELLKLLNIPFEVCPPKYEEIPQSNLCPAEEALQFAREKAKSLQSQFPESILIACDTIVEIDGKKMGKPKDEVQAVEMLMALSGRIHRVLTGVSVLETSSGKFKECLGQTLVMMHPFNETEALAYVATGEPMGKAGAYAIQGKGSKLIEKIEGDYFNVVGLPLRDLADLLKVVGVSISANLDEIYSSSGFQ